MSIRLENLIKTQAINLRKKVFLYYFCPFTQKKEYFSDDAFEIEIFIKYVNKEINQLQSSSNTDSESVKDNLTQKAFDVSYQKNFSEKVKKSESLFNSLIMVNDIQKSIQNIMNFDQNNRKRDKIDTSVKERDGVVMKWPYNYFDFSAQNLVKVKLYFISRYIFKK